MKIEVPSTLEEWNRRGAAFLPGHLRITFDVVSAEEVRARLAIATDVMSWNGFLHAGTVVSLADTCCGYGTLAGLPEGADGFTTLDLSANFIGTARNGIVLCSAKPIHAGRSTQVWDARISAETSGRIIAHFRCTQMVLWPRS